MPSLKYVAHFVIVSISSSCGSLVIFLSLLSYNILIGNRPTPKKSIYHLFAFVALICSYEQCYTWFLYIYLNSLLPQYFYIGKPGNTICGFIKNKSILNSAMLLWPKIMGFA